MPHTTCAHCDVTIADHSTMVERNNQTFCCSNCAEAMTSRTMPTGTATCAHCQSPIVDQSAMVQRDGMSFCCNNCAMAMPSGTSQRTM